MTPESRSPGRDHPTRAARRVLRNTAYLSIAEVGNKAFMFVFFVFTARHLGVERYGTLSFAIAFVTMAAVFTDLGLGFYSAREIARRREQAQVLVGNSLTIKLLASLVLILLVIVVARVLGYPPTAVWVVALVSPFVLTSAVVMYAGFVFQGFERMAFTALVRLVQTGLLMLGALLFMTESPSVKAYALLYVLASAVAGGLAIGLGSARLVAFRPRFDFQKWGLILRRSLPFGIAAVFVVFYYWNGSALLASLKGDVAVGYFSAPFRLVLGAGFLASAFSGAMYPVLSRLHLGPPDRMRDAVSSSLRYMMMVGIPLFLVGSTLARPLLVFIYGDEYLAAVGVFQVLLFWAGLVYVNSLLSNYFYAIDRPRVVMIQSGLALAFAVLLNVVLIPRFGAAGAACALAAAELAGMVFLSAKQLATPAGVGVKTPGVAGLRILGAAVVASAVSWLLARWHVAAGLAAGIAVYLVLLYLLRGLTRADAALLGQVLRPNRE